MEREILITISSSCVATQVSVAFCQPAHKNIQWKIPKKNMCHIITASRVLTLRRKKISLMNFVACPFMSKRFESRFNE